MKKKFVSLVFIVTLLLFYSCTEQEIVYTYFCIFRMWICAVSDCFFSSQYILSLCPVNFQIEKIYHTDNYNQHRAVIIAITKILPTTQPSPAIFITCIILFFFSPLAVCVWVLKKKVKQNNNKIQLNKPYVQTYEEKREILKKLKVWGNQLITYQKQKKIC